MGNASSRTGFPAGIILLALCFLVCTAVCHAGNTVTIVSSNYEPYTSSINRGSGVILEIIREAFKEVKIDVKFRFYPWKRGQLKIDSGQAYAAVPYFKTEERLLSYDYSDPILPIFLRVFYNKERFPEGFEWNSIEDFRGYKMGGVIGYWYIPLFKKNELKTELVATDLQNMRKLALQRIDFMVLDELTAMRLVREHLSRERHKIGMLNKPFSDENIHLLVSRTYPNSREITKKFNKGLEILKSKKRYHEILDSYNLPVPRDFQ